jgi:hypothetical protein
MSTPDIVRNAFPCSFDPESSARCPGGGGRDAVLPGVFDTDRSSARGGAWSRESAVESDAAPRPSNSTRRRAAATRSSEDAPLDGGDGGASRTGLGDASDKDITVCAVCGVATTIPLAFAFALALALAGGDGDGDARSSVVGDARSTAPARAPTASRMFSGTRNTSTFKITFGSRLDFNRIDADVHSTFAGSSNVSHCSFTPKFGLKKTKRSVARFRAWRNLPPAAADRNPKKDPWRTNSRCVAGSAIETASSSVDSTNRVGAPDARAPSAGRATYGSPFADTNATTSPSLSRRPVRAGSPAARVATGLETGLGGSARGGGGAAAGAAGAAAARRRRRASTSTSSSSSLDDAASGARSARCARRQSGVVGADLRAPGVTRRGNGTVAASETGWDSGDGRGEARDGDGRGRYGEVTSTGALEIEIRANGRRVRRRDRGGSARTSEQCLRGLLRPRVVHDVILLHRARYVTTASARSANGARFAPSERPYRRENSPRAARSTIVSTDRRATAFERRRGVSTSING